MIEELQGHIDKIMHERNNRGLPNFEGYSPFEMHHILHDTFGNHSPIQLNRLTDLGYSSIPILNQIKYLVELIGQRGELKLTNKGFLPTKVVADIYGQGFIIDEHIESGITKLYAETSATSINLTRILVEISGLTKKRHNKLSLTKTGKKIVSDNAKLTALIFKTFGNKFNWAYYDGYGENQVGQIGFGFSTILIGKYGHKKRIDQFYSKKYFKAFPALIVNNLSQFDSSEEQLARCYSIRTFDRFMDYFGIIRIDKEKFWDSDKFITKTELFDQLLFIKPPQNKV